MHDYLVVGAGLFGSVFAHEAAKAGKQVLVVDKRPYIGGNCRTEKIEGIHVHTTGPHIFHSASKRIWDYVEQFATFNNFSYRGRAFYKGRMYSMPVNLTTIQQIYGCNTPAAALAKLNEVRIPCAQPSNLEEWALAHFGPDIYKMLILGYNAKQWDKHPRDLPPGPLRRLPMRLTFNDKWYDDSHREGIPVGGYNQIFERLLHGIEVKLNVDYLADRVELNPMAKKVVYTGAIDEFFGCDLGRLEYRAMTFEHEVLPGDFQGTCIVTYPDQEVPWTRITEHKHFEFVKSDVTVISREIPGPYTGDNVPCHPLNDTSNNTLLAKYQDRVASTGVLFGGRLARFQYYDMDQTIGNALSMAKSEFGT